MKRVANWVSVVGAALGLYQGWRWLSDFSSDLAELAARILGPPPWAAGIALVVTGVLGLMLAGATALGKGRPQLQGALLVVLGFAPFVFSARALFATPMALGGILVIIAWRQSPAPEKPSHATPDEAAPKEVST
jgi:hypothetical protein